MANFALCRTVKSMCESYPPVATLSINPVSIGLVK